MCVVCVFFYNTMLCITGGRYLLLNTAVSSSWGFPTPCPEGCPCNCFDCRDPDCACAVPSGMCNNLPASFLIDYVRVYQAVGYVYCVCIFPPSVLLYFFVCVCVFFSNLLYSFFG
jgi:hypothetical protein